MVDRVFQLRIHHRLGDPLLNVLANGGATLLGQELAERTVAEVVADASEERSHRRVELVSLGEGGQLIGNGRGDPAQRRLNLGQEGRRYFLLEGPPLVVQQCLDEPPNCAAERGLQLRGRHLFCQISGGE